MAGQDEISKAQANAAQANDDAPATIFDKILAKEIPSTEVFSDDLCYAFRDISPQAKVHFLVIPKVRDGLTMLEKAREDQEELLGHLLKVAGELGAKECPDGFRVMINNGVDGCQSVYHLHLHVIGGEVLKDTGDLVSPPEDPNEGTIFSKIVAGDIPSTEVYSDETVYAFKDIAPMAAFHHVFIPKEKNGLSQLRRATDCQKKLLGHILRSAAMNGLKECPKGFRIFINDGYNAGQTVYHLHMHMVGGEQLGWPSSQALSKSS